MVVLSDLRSKLVRRIHRRIDVPAKLLLSRGKSMHHILKWRISNDQEIDVACRAKLAPCRGPEHEGDLNTVAERREPVSQEVEQPSRLGKEPPQLRENRRIAVGLEVHLTALHSAPDQPRCRQQLQFALNGSNGGSSLTNDLPKVVGLVRVAEQPAEHAPAGTAE
jgi:hypothetical protein